MINLLPLQYKKEAERGKRWRTILNLEIFLFLFLISLSLILSAVRISCQGLEKASQIMVEGERKAVAMMEERQISLGLGGLEERLREADRNLDELNSFFLQQGEIGLVFQKLAESLPENSYLTEVSFGEGSAVVVSGFCPDRDSLYLLKNNLENEETWRDLEFPNSNWLNPNSFTASFKYDNERQ